MAVLFRNQTNLPIILYHIRKVLLDNAVYTPSCVFLGVAPENILPPSISYCEIIPGRQLNVNPEAGNVLSNETLQFANTIEGDVYFDLWHRFWVDPANRSTVQLTDQALGILQKVNLINQYLNLAELTDANNWILCNPMHWTEQLPLTDKDHQKWLGVRLVYRIRYGYDPTAYSEELSGIHAYNQEYACDYSSTNIDLGTCP
jgi:hypothetical protein